MKILVVCQYYYPEPFRIHEVCEELVNRGHKVTVLTGIPNYPMGEIPKEYQNNQRREEVMNGVSVIRVNEIPRTSGRIGLSKNYLSFVVNGTKKALIMKEDFDVIFVYQLSPILMAIPAFVVKWLTGKKLVLYSLDLWPESLVSYKIKKNSLFFQFMKYVSKRIYQGAYCIGYTSFLFKAYFQEELGIKKGRFKYIPQFADQFFEDASGGKYCDVMNESNDEKNREFHFVYAGNVGKLQSVETIVRAASYTKNEPIKWHIVGDGSSIKDCEKLAKKLHTDNLIFHGRYPASELEKFYDLADVMVTTFSKDALCTYTLPGKIQSYMAAKKPILGAAGGETNRVIHDAKCGSCVPAEDSKALADKAIQCETMNYEVHPIVTSYLREPMIWYMRCHPLVEDDHYHP